jgi:hypothetical protein
VRLAPAIISLPVQHVTCYETRGERNASGISPGHNRTRPSFIPDGQRSHFLNGFVVHLDIDNGEPYNQCISAKVSSDTNI